MRSDVVVACMKDVGPILGQMEALALHVLASRCPTGNHGGGGGAQPTKQRTREQRGVRLGSARTTTPTDMEPFFLPFPSSFDDFYLFRPSKYVAAYRGSTSLVRFRKRKRVRTIGKAFLWHSPLRVISTHCRFANNNKYECKTYQVLHGSCPCVRTVLGGASYS